MYQKGRSLEWWVDSEEYFIIDMENDVGDHFSWSIFQEANFLFEDQKGQINRLATDQQLIGLLRTSKLVKMSTNLWSVMPMIWYRSHLEV